jgi:hypothetical protein
MLCRGLDAIVEVAKITAIVKEEVIMCTRDYMKKMTHMRRGSSIPQSDWVQYPPQHKA